jgi:Na+/H+ antiporter NhaD/arsenite permease-like protein
MGFMITNFGWKAILGILLSNSLYFLLFRRQFSDLKDPFSGLDANTPARWEEREDPIPPVITAVHLLFLGWTVFMAHYPPLFLGGFLILLGFTEATGHHQNDVRMRMPLLVGCFLAGLVVHGGCQGWWIELLLTTFDNEWILMIGATILTAFNDNAAVTYLASQAPQLAEAAKYAVVAGAVTGGGLTVIANAPNPAGQAILGRFFQGGVSPAKLALAALLPTIIVGTAFMLL